MVRGSWSGNDGKQYEWHAGRFKEEQEMAVTLKLRLEKPCKLWAGRTSEKGYGIRWYAQTGKDERVHRIAYAEHHGLTMDDIAGVIIRHKCDTPGCIEPTHLLAGTVADNNRDTRERWRARYGCHKGEANGQSKLTDAQVQEIWQRLADGQTEQQIAAEFSVSGMVISRIKTGQQWTHVKVADDTRDTVKKGMPHGTQHWKVKLTADQVREIKRRLADGYRNGAALAREYGVDPKTISDIKRGKNWAWLTAA